MTLRSIEYANLQTKMIFSIHTPLHFQDPENEDGPLQPDVFIENLYDGIAKGSTVYKKDENGNNVESDDKNVIVGTN